MSLFRKPDESTSSDESHVISKDLSKNDDPMAGDSGSKLPKSTKALSPRNRPSSRHPATLPTMTQFQRDAFFQLCQTEVNCRASAKDELNRSREPADQFAEDHPEVVSLTEKLLAPFAKKFSQQTDLSKDLAGEDYAELRNVFITQFRGLLDNAARKHIRQILEPELESSSSPKAISAGFVGIAGVLHNSQLLPNAGVGSALPSMSGVATDSLKIDSTYESEYQEISILGKGGYGQVFRVKSHVDNQEYAIKKILITSRRVKSHIEADKSHTLLAEVRTLAKLHHTNVVRYFHAWVEPHTPAAPSSSTAISGERAVSSRMLTDPETGDDSGRESSGVPAVEEIDDDNVVSENSSAHDDQDPPVDTSRVRRESLATAASNMTLRSSVHSLIEEEYDPEVEEIPRAAKDIGVSLSKADLSAIRAAVEPSVESKYLGKDIIVCIKMSLHPMTLSTYLSVDSPETADITALRHCFHRETSVSILSAILDGLEYLHSQGIIHRDVKPANVFLSIHEHSPPSLSGCVNIMGCSECTHVDTSKRIYITPCIGDFGLSTDYKQPTPLSRPESNLELPHLAPSPFSTVQHKPVGTKLYRPSSLPKEEPVICARLDVYSLGVVALELIHKFSTKSERISVLSRLKEGVLPSQFRDHVMAKGIKSMVREERDRRWDCVEVRKWLEALQGKGKGRGPM